MFRYLYVRQFFQNLIYTLPAILIAISAHEYAHGFVSYKLGDPTPKKDGRLTLNPFAHMDVIGTLCLVFFRMGWAKPVRINVGYYKNRKLGMILVALAGPVMNYILAFISMLLYGICYKNGLGAGIWFYYSAVVNVGLGTFNLIPIPPLDGSNVLMEIIPKVQTFYMKIRRYAPIFLFVIMSLGLLRYPLNWVNNGVLDGMWSVVKNMLDIGVKKHSTGNFI